MKFLLEHFQRMKNIRKVFEIIPMILPTNAEAERIWSNFNFILNDRHMTNIIKDTLEYRLKVERCKCKMEDFDPS